MTTPQESRERYLDSIFTLDEVIYLQSLGLYDRYVTGEIDIDEIYKQLKDQGV
jgi:hypothetical protein